MNKTEIRSQYCVQIDHVVDLEFIELYLIKFTTSRTNFFSNFECQKLMFCEKTCSIVDINQFDFDFDRLCQNATSKKK